MPGLLLADSIYRGRVGAQTLLGIFINHVMVCAETNEIDPKTY